MKYRNFGIGLFGLAIISIFSTCEGVSTNNIIETSKSEHDRLQAELSSNYDTIFEDTYFLRYVLDSNQLIHIVWGNEQFERSIDDEEYPGWAPSEFETEWEDYIGLFHSCGTCPRRTHILLPKNETDSVQFYQSHYATSPDLNLIFYHCVMLDAHGGDIPEDNEFCLENIITKQRQIIPLDSIGGYPSA